MAGPQGSLCSATAELLLRLWPCRHWCVKLHGNIICGACFHFWLEKMREEQQRKHNQSGKQLMREKILCWSPLLQPWSRIARAQCADKLCFYHFSCPGAEGHRQRVAYRNGSCLFIGKAVAIGNPSLASKHCICLQRCCLGADRWRAADTIPVYFLQYWWLYIGYWVMNCSQIYTEKCSPFKYRFSAHIIHLLPSAKSPLAMQAD